MAVSTENELENTEQLPYVHEKQFGDEKDIELTAHAFDIADRLENVEYSLFTWPMARLMLVLLVGYLCGIVNGYDGSLMGSINGMTSYQEFFHM